jgi:hypothetical protein
MRRSWQVLLVVTAALALVALLISVAFAAMSRPTAKTLRFTQQFLTTEPLNVNLKGAPGDELVVASKLFAGDKEAGRLGQVCTSSSRRSRSASTPRSSSACRPLSWRVVKSTVRVCWCRRSMGSGLGSMVALAPTRKRLGSGSLSMTLAAARS